MRRLVAAMAIALAACSSSSSGAQHDTRTVGLTYLNARRRLLFTFKNIREDIPGYVATGSVPYATGAAQTMEGDLNSLIRSIAGMPFPSSVHTQLVALESANNAELGALLRMSSAKSMADFTAAQQQEQTTSAAADAASESLTDALGVQTFHPTAHLAPDGVPTVATAAAFPSASGGTVTVHTGATDPVLLRLDGPNRSTEQVEADVSGTGDAQPGLLCLATGQSGTVLQAYGAFLDVRQQMLHVHYYPHGAQTFPLEWEDVLRVPGIRRAGGNHVRIDCFEHYITVSINGAAVYQTYDPSVSSGTAGLISVPGPGGVSGDATFSQFAFRAH